ncbi:helix-turn-helix transcriptional regulator [Bacillus mycoides]|uniref:helix-turn-helix transcriptional regulator n=1 Tax=Bacillus mycoides TaxID=1405 RepID=UPI002E1DFD68|nr:helix-turn-helix transcriptional regulator [Bacillus mycoides]
MKPRVQITLEAARKNIGYSQKEAGDLFGVHYQTIGSWEKDNSDMPASAIEKIPQIYHLPSRMIFFGNKNEFIRSLKRKLIKGNIH